MGQGFLQGTRMALVNFLALVKIQCVLNQNHVICNIVFTFSEIGMHAHNCISVIIKRVSVP